MPHRTLITDCRPYDAAPDTPLHHVLIEDGTIQAITPDRPDGPADRTIDAGGRLVAPGFIDVHIHGAGGADTLDGTDEALRTISRTLAQMGTTAFLATTFAQPERRHEHLGVAARNVGKDLGGAHLLGLHIEGPFINPARRGGILPEVIYPYTPEALDDVLEAAGGALRMMTIAPEMEGHLEAIERLARHGAIASFGHSDATYDETRAGFDAGIGHVTHLYNAMRPFHHREPGPLLAILESDVTAQLIADDVHVGSEVVRWTLEQLGPDRCVCITDGMQGTGLPEGRYTFNGRPYEARGGAGRYLDGTLIGTTLGLAAVVQRFHRFTGCSVQTAVDSATRVPARLLGLDPKGTLAEGADADLVLLDDDLQVQATFVSGELVYHDEAVDVSAE